MKGYKIILPKKSFYVIAPLNKRALAFLIDLLIFFFFIMTPFLSNYYNLAGVPLDNISFEQLLSSPSLLRITMIGDFAVYAVFYFYLIACELLFNASLGKRLLNLSVISKNNRKLSTLQAMIRNITKSLALTFLPFDAILVFFDSERRRLLDYLSNTLVVENKKRIKTFPVVNEV